jgi:hypothetical protein
MLGSVSPSSGQAGDLGAHGITTRVAMWPYLVRILPQDAADGAQERNEEKERKQKQDLEVRRPATEAIVQPLKEG